MTTKAIATQSPLNAGIDYTGCVIATPYKHEGRWEALIPAGTYQVKTDGTLATLRVAIIRGDGAATPATVTGVVKVTTTGNLLVTVKRDPVPEGCKQARAASAAQGKAAFKANGGKFPVRVKQAPNVPVMPGQQVTTQQAPQQAPQVTSQDADYQAFLIWQAAQRTGTHNAMGIPTSQAQSVPVMPTTTSTPKSKGGKLAPRI